MEGDQDGLQVKVAARVLLLYDETIEQLQGQLATVTAERDALRKALEACVEDSGYPAGESSLYDECRRLIAAAKDFEAAEGSSGRT